ncbi:hypothetical protein MHPYR_430055 [uncultured Mycobacterium sp.]|uniref:Uncharacterized protein n=1 Tax=uncultured Mycobacterium sp. TaxID=171292 RepID=A0A1Y5PFI3_9MYCO|nr:hypothetical protein MHPYR_430055 [uncultured Mycobacterium sp.]
MGTGPEPPPSRTTRVLFSHLNQVWHTVPVDDAAGARRKGIEDRLHTFPGEITESCRPHDEHVSGTGGHTREGGVVICLKMHLPVKAPADLSGTRIQPCDVIGTQPHLSRPPRQAL